ncbi:MAG: amylo-alpha-1,6-glucosidase [Pseudomonadota bacterium]
MNKQPKITQDPSPGYTSVMYCGDSLTIRLTLSFKTSGQAFVRTNLGFADTSRKEIINRIEKDEIKLDGAWYDIEMSQDNDLTYVIVLPLHQTGFFQVKCFFLPEKSNIPLWPAGENTVINVEPAGTICANIIYNAFVRQFGKTKYCNAQDNNLSSTITDLDQKGYTVIPESGKFRDLIKEIPFIFSRLGCRVLHLLPIHPTPTTYARMGRFGSPYAALNFTEVDPALAQFDPKATPLEQFLELVDTVHYHHGYLFMDIAINHTGWAASIHESHPEWLLRDQEGKIEVPGAWGVEWADLTRLDYSNKDLWKYMAEVFLLWCHRGVDGFRCDAGYMIPVEAWEYIVAKVRHEYPDTLFFLEGLGGPIQTTRQILGQANFNWAYSELFQNYSRSQISDYLPVAYDISYTCGHLIHFAETHDNNRLASVSHVYAKMRTSLCALFSVCGGFGFANGVEWFATQKIDVHESCSLNWDAPDNQVAHIARLNLILSSHPAFFARTRLSLISKNDSQGLVMLRHNKEYDKAILVLVNLDCEKNNEVFWHSQTLVLKHSVMVDLISGARINIEQTKNDCRVKLSPGQALALTQDEDDLALIERQNSNKQPTRVYQQKLMAKVLAIHAILKGFGDLNKLDISKYATELAGNPVEFIRSLNTQSNESRVIVFDIQKDCNRQVMVPPGFFLVIKSEFGFRAQLFEKKRSQKIFLGYEEGLPTLNQKEYFALFPPQKIVKQHKELHLSLRIFTPDKTFIQNVMLLYLAPFESLFMRSTFTRKEIVNSPFLKLLSTTQHGGMMRAAAWWGRLDSRYDALLAANMDPHVPENRWMVLSRYRIWAVFQGHSRELAPDCLETFTFSYDSGGKWRFHVPTSEGKYYVIELYLSMDRNKNQVFLTIARPGITDDTMGLLEDEKPVTLIIRPDIEDRSFHDTVKAFTGPENRWPGAVQAFENGFFFSLANSKHLCVALSKGKYVHEPEWHYMVHRPMEAQRGLDAESDLFSPGYCTFTCTGTESVLVHAAVLDNKDQKKEMAQNAETVQINSFEASMDLSQSLVNALDAFLVDRNADKSVIAGFPWFLDWGRDSLIFCRSLIELERFQDARAVLRLFGRFENKGTLPNMICGKDARNIETSDAPLWFFACCKDLVEKEKNQDFLDEILDGRSVRQILLSIANSILDGTPTGVKADPETCLVYSPSHFTWMDTNFPAGSPRQGYPVEIQALWVNALIFLAAIDPEHETEWSARAKTAQSAIAQLFYNKSLGFFADCLHCDGPVGARQATPDDALRPNQLFLLSLSVIQDPHMAQKTVETCLELLVPGGIRSLADRKLEYPINIIYNGRLINNPVSPYIGKYEGDEDTQRKPAYHNGTAWTWPFPVFCEAWAHVFGPNSHSTCLAWLGSVITLMRKGAAGYIPEILDGNFPHTPRGCDAQAWGVSEAARVVHKLLNHI